MKTSLIAYAAAKEGSAGAGQTATKAPPADIPRDRFKNTRDPAAPSGAIVVDNLDGPEKHPAAATGSRFFSASVDGDWVVTNARFQIVRKGPFKNEQEASDEAAKLNALDEAATLDFE